MSLAKLDLQALPQLKSYWICNWFLKKDESSKVRCARNQNMHRVENTSTSKLISCKHAFNNIFLIQKSFFFSIFLLLFILIWNISSLNYLFIISMFLRVNNVSSTSISLAHLTMFFIVVIMILFIFSSSLMKIFTSNFLQWFCIDDDMLILNIRWLSNDVINFTFTFFA